MNRIVEDPKTKKLYFEGQTVFMDFDGTPLASRDTSGWKVIAQCDLAKSWWQEPGRFRTYNGLATIAVVKGPAQVETFTMGGKIQTILNWVADRKDEGQAVSLMWRHAYSCRNAARALADVEV